MLDVPSDATSGQSGRDVGPFSLTLDGDRSASYRLVPVSERADIVGIPRVISGLCWKGCADPRCQVFKEKKARRIFECAAHDDGVSEEEVGRRLFDKLLYSSSLAQAGGAPAMIYPGLISGTTVTPFAESRWQEMVLFTESVFAPYGETVIVLAAHTPCKDQGKSFDDMARSLAEVLVIGREKFRSVPGAHVIALLYDLEGKVRLYGDTLRPREGLRQLLDHPLWQVVVELAEAS